MARQQRLQQELVEMAKNPPSLCSAGPVRGDLSNWSATITGPPTSPYHGGLFRLTIHFPDNYPLGPPQVRFVTKVYHLNINESGGICLDILKNKWKPEISVGRLLLAICNLLTHPNPDDPLDGAKCQVYKQDRIGYSQHAQKWTQEYAK